MKKILSILLCFTLIFTVVSCGGPKPEETVTNMLESFKAGDVNNLGNYFIDGVNPKDDALGVFANISFMQDTLENYIVKNSSALQYTVINSEKNEDKTYTVTVECTYVDGKAVLVQSVTDVMEKTVSTVLTAIFNPAELQNTLNESFEETAETLEPTTSTETVTFTLTKVDKQWLISDYDEKLNNVLLKNFGDAVQAVTDLLK